MSRGWKWDPYDNGLCACGAVAPGVLFGWSLCRRGGGLWILQSASASAPSGASIMGEWCPSGLCALGGNQLESCE